MPVFTNDELVSELLTEQPDIVLNDNQRLEIIKHLDDRGVELLKCEFCMMAARFGHFQSLQYLHEKCGCPLFGGVFLKTEDLVSCVIRGGNIDCLKYLHEHGMKLDSFDTGTMAIYNRIDMLQYAHEQGCPWQDNVCSITARHRDGGACLYVHQHGARWTEMTSNIIAYHRISTIARYASDNGLPPPSSQFMSDWNQMIEETMM